MVSPWGKQRKFELNKEKKRDGSKYYSDKTLGYIK